MLQWAFGPTSLSPHGTWETGSSHCWLCLSLFCPPLGNWRPTWWLISRVFLRLLSFFWGGNIAILFYFICHCCSLVAKLYLILFTTPWTVACQALSMGFSRQEYWAGCHSLSRGSSWPRDRTCIFWQMDSLPSELSGMPLLFFSEV